MSIFFERPVMAPADTKELEYISALHQTDMIGGLRENGSILGVSFIAFTHTVQNQTAIDIVRFLKSRYGLVVTEKQAQKEIIGSLGGEDFDDIDNIDKDGDNGVPQGGCLDLMELTAALFIPTLLKARSLEFSNGPEKADRWIKPAPGLLSKALSVILADVAGHHDAILAPAGTEGSPVLNEELLQRIFVMYGETDLAMDKQLIQEMLHIVTSGNGNSDAPVRLDTPTFGTALTKDIELWDLQNENRCSTNYADIMDGGNETKEKGDNIASDDDEEKVITHKYETTGVDTIPAIDSTASTYRSKSIVVLLWTTVIVTSFAYNAQANLSIDDACPAYEYHRTAPWGRNIGSVSCQSGYKIINWVINFFYYCFVGFAMVSLGSIGNSAGSKEKCRPIIASIFVFIFAIVPYLSPETQENVRGKGLLNNISLILAICVIMLHFSNLLVISVSTERLRESVNLRRLTYFSRVTVDRDARRSAAHKINNLIGNALDVTLPSADKMKPEHEMRRSIYRRALHEYTTSGKVLEETGGFRWTWERIIDGRIGSEYGIHYSSRLQSANLTQYIVCCYMIIAGIALARTVEREFDEDSTKDAVLSIANSAMDQTVNNDTLAVLVSNMTSLIGSFLANQPADTLDAFNCSSALGVTNINASSICKFIEQSTSKQINQLSLEDRFQLLDGAGFDVRIMEKVMRNGLEDAAESSVESLYPSSKYMIYWPVVIGTIAAFLTAVYLATSFLPSATSTVLKLRCGVIPSLSDKKFQEYRRAQDQVSVVIGNIFWGAIFASILVGGIIGGLLFLCLWQAVAYYVQKFVAIAIGVLAIFLIRLVILIFLRKSFYMAFYRLRPRATNMTSVGLEWANFTLSIGFVFLRIVKLLLAAAFFVGRVDTPFLAPQVGMLGNLELDGAPTHFLRGILAHEAHRHPYIDLLGSVYLMKIRHGDRFASRAGSAWRLIFVYALMPWMQKYRLQKGEELKRFNYVREAETKTFKEIIQPLGGAWIEKTLHLNNKNESCEVQISADPGDVPQVESKRQSTNGSTSPAEESESQKSFSLVGDSTEKSSSSMEPASTKSLSSGELLESLRMERGALDAKIRELTGQLE